MKTLTISTDAPVRGQFDVVVCGGGPSGIAAAIAAKRAGASVLLIEQSAILGGSATLAGVAVYMPVGNITGFYAELVNDLQLRDHKGRDPQQRFSPHFSPHEMRLYFNEKLAAEGVTVWYHTSFVDAAVQNNFAKAVILHTREGLVAVETKFVIDATGNANVARACGAQLTSGREEDGATQPMTLMFGMLDTHQPVTPHLPAGCPNYDTVESLPQGRVLTWLDQDSGQLLVNMTRVRGNGAKIDDINHAEREGLRQVFGVVHFLQRHDFKTFRLAWVAPQIGVRETFQIVGHHTLHEDDCTRGQRFDDVIAQTNYGIDIHNPTGTSGTLQTEVQLYDIPFRTIVPAHGAHNVLVAGRTLSATHVAMSSARVMPTCMALGQAAGIAAALCTQRNLPAQSTPIPDLHAQLKQQGVTFTGH